MTVRTRFAPSPTGYLHIGGVRTALFSWLYARRHGGTFILRIEDTDLERSTVEAVNAILEGMAWLGLDYDEGPIFQTHRFDRYRAVAERLLEEGKAYRCYCSKERLETLRAEQMACKEKPRYDGLCRQRHGPPPAGIQPVIRFRSPKDGVVVVDDLIKGRIPFQNAELDDLIIVRGDGSPTYNFTVVVDDLDMRITHVIRGDDHVNNTPRQMNILRALGAECPAYAHVPMILGPDGQKLSKRHGAVSVLQYRDEGFLPEALLNYLVRLGWSHGDQEIFTMEELIREFSLESVGKSAAVFNPEKLLWLNQHYIMSYPPERLVEEMLPFWRARGFDTSDHRFVSKVAADLRTRAKTLVEMADSGGFYFRDDVTYEPEAAAKFLIPEYAGHLEAVAERLPGLGDYTKDGVEAFLRSLADERGTKLKWIAQALRVALTGKTVSPGIDEVMVTLGKERVIQRLERAIAQSSRA